VPATFLKFSSKACGNYVSLNATNTYIMGNKIRAWTKQTWPTPGTPSMDPILKFLEQRKTEEGVSLKSKLGEPEPYKDGWYRMAWRDFNASELPKTTGNQKWPGASEWTSGFHGTKLETIYKTMCDGYLNESTLEPGR
jgi:hypothetical protein